MEMKGVRRVHMVAQTPRDDGPADDPADAPGVSGLGFEELRVHRGDLRARADQLTSWHRFLTGWLDLVLADALDPSDPGNLHDPLDPGNLHDPCGLADLAGVGLGGPLRSMTQDATDEEALAVLWRRCAPHDAHDRGRLVARLAYADRRLATRRATVAVQLEQATTELVTRYGQDPDRCVAAVLASYVGESPGPRG